VNILFILPYDNIYRYRSLANKLIGPYAPYGIYITASM
jgi:hypothetical protein